MANFNFNKVILGGRVTDNIELKQTQSGTQFVSFSIAVNRPYSKNKEQQEVDFINIVCYGERSKFVSSYFNKGSSICIVGSLQVRKWTDKDGNKRYATDVIADEVNFVDSKNENAGPLPAPEAPKHTSADSAKFEDVTEDDDLPF